MLGWWGSGGSGEVLGEGCGERRSTILSTMRDGDVPFRRRVVFQLRNLTEGESVSGVSRLDEDIRNVS